MLVLCELKATSNDETTSIMSGIISGSTAYQQHDTNTTRKVLS